MTRSATLAPARAGRRFGPVVAASILAGFLLLAAPAPAIAATAAPSASATRSAPAVATAGLAGYRARVARARALVAEALPRIEDRKVAGHTVVELILLLPAGERVRVGDRLVLADHGALRAQILKLDVTRDAKTRREQGTKILAYLTSLEAAVGSSGPGVPSDPVALRRLLARTQVPKESPIIKRLTEAFDRLIQMVRDWLANSAVAPSSSAGARVAWTLVLVLLVGLAAWALYSVASAWRRSVAAKAAQVPGAGQEGPPVVAAEAELPPDALAYADGLAGEARFRDALRALFGGAARSLAEAGLLFRTRTRTNAELLAELEPTSGVLPPMRDLTGSFERAWYGHVDPDPGGYAEARERYAAVVEASKADRDAAPGEDAATSGEREP